MTEYICHYCKTTIAEKDSAMVNDIPTKPRWYHAICRVAEERDELRRRIAELEPLVKALASKLEYALFNDLDGQKVQDAQDVIAQAKKAVQQ